MIGVVALSTELSSLIFDLLRKLLFKFNLGLILKTADINRVLIVIVIGITALLVEQLFFHYLVGGQLLLLFLPPLLVVCVEAFILDHCLDPVMLCLLVDCLVQFKIEQR